MVNTVTHTQAVSLTTAVNLSNMKISNNPVETLVAFSIGSGIGLAIHDSVIGVGGILNIMLPDSTQTTGISAGRSPFMFADTAVPSFIQALYEQGTLPERMKVVIVGGANIVDCNGLFNIGQKNREAVQTFLSQHHLNIHYEDTGGTISRTLSLEIGSGCSSIRIFGRGELKI